VLTRQLFAFTVLALAWAGCTLSRLGTSAGSSTGGAAGMAGEGGDGGGGAPGGDGGMPAGNGGTPNGGHGGDGGSGGIVNTCGDGVINADDECDDGNDVGDDGCSNTCDVICPAGWFKAPDGQPNAFHCYEFFGTPVGGADSDFAAASADCVALGEDFHLATATSTAEIDDIRALITGPNGPYIGGVDPASDCMFEWVTAEPWTWGQSGAAWAGGMQNGCATEDCLQIYGGGAFNDYDCSLPLPWICEMDPAEEP
jgi:cysteine-rich repeat protein